MQRQKNIRLLISLAIIIAITSIIFILSNSKSNSSVDKNIFQIDNLEKIDHIVLESPKEKTELKFNGTKWRVNEKFEADDQLITVLFATLKQTQVERQVASRLQDSIQKEIINHGTKISCFEGSNPAKEFWSAGNAQRTETYFQLSGGKPYVVTIPGYRVYIASIFELMQNDWRNKLVFNFNWQNIKDIEVSFPSDAKENFKASFQGKYFSIEGIETDTTKLDKFMDALFQLRAEKILDSVETKNYQTILEQNPLMEIKIHDVANQAYPLTIYPFERGNNFLIGKSNNDMVLLNPLVLRGIFKKKEQFISKGKGD